MAAAAIFLGTYFSETFLPSDLEALDVDGTGFSILFGAETGFECGGLCLGEGVASLRIVLGSSWRTMADCGGVCASDWVDWVTIWLKESSESMETRCAAFAAFSAAANELSDVELEKKRAKRVDTRSMVYNGHREISIYSRGWPLPPQKSLVLACLRSASKISLRESKNSSRNSPATTRRRRPRAPSPLPQRPRCRGRARTSSMTFGNVELVGGLTM